MTDTTARRRRTTCPRECTRCFYCDAWVPLAHEHDHYPVPRSAGGQALVTACMNCHELKDRVPPDQWPVGMLVEAIQQSGRFLLALALDDPATLRLEADGIDAATEAMTAVPLELLVPFEDRMPEWGMPGRILYAKFRRLAEQRDAARRSA